MSRDLCRINVEESNIEILVDTLLSRIRKLEKDIADLQYVTADALYSKFKHTKEKAMKEALTKAGLDFATFKPGDLVVGIYGIYLVRTVRKDGFGYASAWLTDFCCDNEHDFKMELADRSGALEIDPSDDQRIASNFETLLFDNELEKVGYRRTDNGTLVKI